MAEKYRNGRLGPVTSESGRLAEVAEVAVRKYSEAMERLALHEAAFAAYTLIDAANEFIAETEPWVLARDSSKSDRLHQVLSELVEAVRIAAVLLLPVMPRSAEMILERMGDPAVTGGRRFDQATRWSTQKERILVRGPALWPRAVKGKAQVNE